MELGRGEGVGENAFAGWVHCFSLYKMNVLRRELYVTYEESWDIN